MLRKFIFKNNVTGQELALPVTPAAFSIDHGNHVETVNLHLVGDVHLPAGRALFTASIDCLFPRRAYPFLLPGASLDPFTYLDFFEFSSDRRETLRFVISDTPTICDVLVENVQYGEQDGTNDVYCTLTLRRYMAPRLTGSTASPVQTSAAPARPAPAAAAVQESYIVVRGDTLSAICRRFYGNASLYHKLARANGIANPHLIHPGQVLRLPARDSL